MKPLAINEEGVILKALLDSALDGILIIDNNGQRVFANARLYDSFKVPDEIRNESNDEVLLKHVASLVKNRDEFLAGVKSQNDHPERTMHDELEFKDGTTFDRYSTVIRNLDGTYCGRIWTFRDITGYKRAQSDLLEKQERLGLALKCARMGTFDWNIPDNKRIWDDNVHQLLGSRPGTFSGTSEEFLSIIHPQDRTAVEAALRKALETLEVYETEYRVIWRDGTVHYIAARGKVHCDSAGLPMRMAGICWDLTDRKKVEKEREELLQQLYDTNTALAKLNHDLKCTNEQLEKEISEHQRAEAKLLENDKLKTEFVATVSHELRTPLCIFKNIISNALAGVAGAITPKLRENLNIAENAVDRLSRIISDFLDVSKIDSGKLQLRLQHLKIQSVVNNVLTSMTPLAQEKKVTLELLLPDKPLFIDADYDRIMQVLTNLISNALKFTPINGSVSIYVTELEDEIRVEVIDTGIGIRADDISKVFTRFVQIEKVVGPGQHGTGLGLSIAKDIIEKHGGRIWVESTLGSGTSCCFVLPKSQQDSTERNVSDTMCRSL